MYFQPCLLYVWQQSGFELQIMEMMLLHESTSQPSVISVRDKVVGQAMTSKGKESFLLLLISLHPEGKKGRCYWRNNRILEERRSRASLSYKLKKR